MPLLLILAAVTLFLSTTLVHAHGMSEAEKQAIIDGGNLSFLWLGATHMLTGFDHLAFVFGIVFFLTRFRDIVKYVTAFTLGHSATLIYATFNGIQINYFLIDAVIALSVCYIAFANIDGFRKYLNINPPNMMLMIFGLGLIHGFGLSTRLQELPLSEDALLLNIISFNVGVEFGQIAALAVMLLLIAAWRRGRFFQTFSLVTNHGLILAGVLLFLMQIHGYEHSSNPELLAVSAAPAPAVATVRPDTAAEAGPAPGSDGWQDSITLTIPPRGDLEYKLLVKGGATFEFVWRTDGGELFFDFHAEPTGDTTGYFHSFMKGTDSRSEGALTAMFDGTHGWYWKNTASSPVQVVLKTRGEYQRPGPPK